MKSSQGIKKKFNVTTTIVFVFLALYVLSLIAMYFWAFYTSLKTRTQFRLSVFSLPSGWPWEWGWSNYVEAVSETAVRVTRGSWRGDVYIGDMLFNSLYYAIGGALINNLTMWLVAYLITRFNKYKLSRILYVLNIVFMTVPIVGSLPSSLYVFKLFGWYDNYLFIIFNNIGFTGMYLLIYCAFIEGLGREFYESAEMDGAGHFTVMTRIAFPLTSSMFLVVLLMFVVTRWNDYMTMVAWMPNYPTLAYGVYYMGDDGRFAFPPTQIALSMLLMLPILVLFFMFQKQMMGNLRLGAIKG